MGLSRSTFYGKPSVPADDGTIVTTMTATCDELGKGESAHDILA